MSEYNNKNFITLHRVIKLYDTDKKSVCFVPFLIHTNPVHCARARVTIYLPFPLCIQTNTVRGVSCLLKRKKNSIDNLEQIKVFSARIVPDKFTTKFFFNIILSFYLVSNISITMVKLIAF